MVGSVKDWSKLYSERRVDTIEGLKAFLRHKSVSTDPAFNDACNECANWLVEELKQAGLEVELLETGFKPVVYAKYDAEPDAPVVLFYGHYDVQPPDPLEAWESDPFDPVVRGDRLYARGAQDNKGQVWYFVSALKALLESQQLGCSVRLMIEGEEESGSEGLSAKLAEWKDRLQADVLVVCDTGALQAGQPTFTMGLRGMIGCTLKVIGPTHDLHSGVHGGIVRNPAIELTRLVSQLFAADGSIAVPGYYDGIATLTSEDQELMLATQIDPEWYQEQTGVLPVGGEEGLSIQERRGLRPTIDVNGLSSGYQGAGMKTIIPAEASAKITSRIVAGQDPARCLKLLMDFLSERAASGVRVEFSDACVGGPGLQLSTSSKLIQSVARVLEQLSNQPVAYIWEGASVPIVPALAAASGGEAVLVGFGLEADRIHAPNESFSLNQFELGFIYAGMLLEGLKREWL